MRYIQKEIMYKLTFVNMPDDFVRLLSANMPQNNSTLNQIEMYLHQKKGMGFLVRSLFKEIDSDGFLSKIVHTAGWNVIRNRLAGAYLENFVVGDFPDAVSIETIQDLILFENKVKFHTTGLNSRSFLLAMYAKMTQEKHKKLFDKKEFSPLVIKDKHIELLRFSTVKNARIDWLLLTLICLSEALGLERLESFLSKGTKFAVLFAMLNEKEQKQFIENLVNYATSIGDLEYVTTVMAS